MVDHAAHRRELPGAQCSCEVCMHVCGWMSVLFRGGGVRDVACQGGRTSARPSFQHDRYAGKVRGMVICSECCRACLDRAAQPNPTQPKQAGHGTARHAPIAARSQREWPGGKGEDEDEGAGLAAASSSAPAVVGSGVGGGARIVMYLGCVRVKWEGESASASDLCRAPRGRRSMGAAAAPADWIDRSIKGRP